MRFQRVLLVSPPYPGSLERASLRPGLGYLAETLERANIEYDVIDMELDHSLSDLKQKIARFEPDLIGMSMMTYKCKRNYGLLDTIRTLTNSPIAVGGPHISALGEQALHECTAIDFGIVGEGEEAILALCRGVALSEVPNLIYRNVGIPTRSCTAQMIHDLDGIPFPRYRKFELKRYLSRAIPIVSSRGCPYRCIFCSIAASMGKKVRTRSPGNVADEIEYWYDRGHRRFGFVDDNLTFYKDRMFALCDVIEQRKLTHLDLNCLNGLRADRVTKRLLRRMKDVGFRSIAIGVEAGNNGVLQRVQKDESMETIEEAIRAACDLGYDVTLFFVIGTPGETWSDIEDSFALAKRYPISNVYFNNLMPYPGSQLYEWVTQQRSFVVQPEDYFDSVSSWSGIPVFETPELPLHERRRALAKARGVSKEVRRRHYEMTLEDLGVVGRIMARFNHLDEIKSYARGTRIGRAVARSLISHCSPKAK